MTRRDDAEALSASQQNRLGLIPDEEQRAVLYQDLLRASDGDDVVNLATAENALVYKHLFDKVFQGMPPLPESSTRYFTPYGRDKLQEKMAARLGHALGADIEKADVFGVAGVSSALACIAVGLQQEVSPAAGDGPVPAGSNVLLPAPFWQGFHWCFEQIAKLNCVPVDLTSRGAENFELTLDDLKRTYEDAKHPPKLLVLTNPHNPLGVNYEKSLLESIYAWALGETEMHIISDEMYCHSQLEGAKPGFVSALSLDATKAAPDRVHVVWGFAKDFGLSGFRAGFAISSSKYVHAAMMGNGQDGHPLPWFTPFDSLKHRYIEPIISDDGKIWKGAMEYYQQALPVSFHAVQDILVAQDIPFVRPKDGNCAVFFWLDLRTFLMGDSESELLDAIKTNTNVLLLSGTSLSCKWPGYCRVCFTAFDKDKVAKAITDVCTYLNSRKPK